MSDVFEPRRIKPKANDVSRIMIVSLMILLAVFGRSVTAADNEAAYAGLDWQLMNLEGQAVQLSEYQGQPVLLVFWATWCPYCKKLLPGIQKLHEKYQTRGLKIIAVNVREDSDPHVYWRNYGYTFDSVLEGDNLAEHYGVRGTPGLVFIDPQGQVMAVQSFSDPNHPVLEKFAEYYTSEKTVADQ